MADDDAPRPPGGRRRVDIRRVFVRDTHPLLFRTYLTFGLVSVGLGLNFLFTTPTFNPYHLDKMLVGTTFLILGLAQIVFLTAFRRIALLRLALAANIAFEVFWGIGASFTYFQGLSSLQLTVLYLGLAFLEFWLLIESPVTLTEKPPE